jgi:hypothetical protein
MDAKSRVPVRLVIMVSSVASAGLLFVVGCSMDKNGILPGKTFARIGGHSGEILEPKRCLLKVAIISRPFDDPAINAVVWKAADEQVIPPKERRAWEANGLRVGRIVGELPLELEAIMNDTTTHQKVSPADIIVESGEPTLIKVSDPVEQATLLFNRDNRPIGSDYRDVSGYFRATAQHEGTNNVSLRLVPEIHHGPIQRTFQSVPNAAAIGPQEFKINNGQQEETIRELATTISLAPGHLVVIGCRPEQKRGLGTFFFTQPVAHSDQRLAKLIMIWASRNLQGVGPDERSTKASDRPTLFKRLVGSQSTPTQAQPKPAPIEPPSPGVDTMLLLDPATLNPGPATTKPLATKAAAQPTTAPPPEPAKPSP